jgi:HEAT repeat protein
LDELASEDPEVRYEAATACGELGAEEAIDDLIRLTSDTDRDVQNAAIVALGRIGGTIATNVLRRLAQSPDPFVREAAEEALTEALFASDPLRPVP